MAQSSVMREFLVALGFKVDAAGESKFKNAADSANKSISELGKSLSAASIGVATLLTVSAAKLDSMAVASQRTGASVGNLKAFQYAVEQLGGTADGALQSIDGLRQKMRESPGYESALKSLGIDTRDGNGKLKDTVEIASQLSKVLSGMSESRAMRESSLLGIDRNTMLAMRDPKFLATLQDYQRTQKELGGDQDQAAESTRQLHQELNKMYATLGIATDSLTGKIAEGLLPAIQGVNEALQATTRWFSQLDPDMQEAIKTTAAWTAGLTALVGTLKAVTSAWGVVKGIATIGAGGAAAGAGGAGSAGTAAASRGFLGTLFGKFAGGLGLLFHSEDLNQGENEFILAQIRARQAAAAARAAKNGVPVAPSSASSKRLPRGIRNNNPGNLDFRGQAGAEKEGGPGGRFAVFKDQQSGLNALANQLLLYSKRGLNSVSQIIGRFAPPNENNTQAYADHVAKSLGVSQNAILNMRDPKVFKTLMDAIIRVENGYNPYSARMLDASAAYAAEKMVELHQSTTITVNGAVDPRGTAREVSDAQNGVNQLLVRNFKTHAR